MSERRDTFDLTGMFANVRPDDWQSQFGGHFDVDYPTAGQRAGRRTSPPPTLSTQSTAVPAVQPAQQADRRGTAEAVSSAPRTQLGASSFSATSEVQAAGLTEFSSIVSVADENIVGLQVKKDEAMTGDSASALVVVQGTTTGPTFARTYERFITSCC